MIPAFSHHTGDGRWMRIEPVVTGDTHAYLWTRNEELNRAVCVLVDAAGLRALAAHATAAADLIDPRPTNTAAPTAEIGA